MNGASELNVCALGSIYSGEKLENFQACVESLKRQMLKVPIFLVIDGPIGIELRDYINKNYNYFEGIFEIELNSGLACALNYGLSKIPQKFDYVIRFDTDDVNREDRFSTLVSNFRDDDTVLGSWVLEFSADSELLKRVPSLVLAGDKKFFFRNPLNHPSVIFRTRAIMDLGGYEHMPFFEDWLLWAKVLRSGGKIRNINIPLLRFRFDTHTLARRRGTRYVRHEALFFLRLMSLYPLYIPIILSAFITRAALRLLPKRIFRYVYNLARKLPNENR